MVYYVSPQLWAWRKGRLKLVQRYVSEMLVIIPFEREFYAQHGVQVEFVGHPLSELEPPKISREDFAARWGLDPSRRWIALLPGSRRKELRLNLPAMLGAAERLGAEFEFVMPVASTLDKDWVREQIALCTSKVDVKLTDDARASLLHARVGSGRQRHGNRGGSADRNALCDGLSRRRTHLDAGAASGKVAALWHGEPGGRTRSGSGADPGRFTPQSVEREVRTLLEDGPARQRMTEALAEVRGMLRGELADAPTFGTHS